MTSKWFPAGTSHGGSHARQAFTLIEIMVVVVIFGIFMAMGLPSIYRVFHKESLLQVVADIEEACHQARAQAIMGWTPTEIVIRPDGISGPGTDARFPAEVGVLELVANGITYTAEQLDNAGGEVHAHFYPNGTCDDVAISLVSELFERRKIALECTTGLTSVEVIR